MSNDIPLSTTVYARNTGRRAFRGRYSGTWHEIPPGVEVPVSYFAMCLWSGDPRSVDTPKVKYRLNEFKRLCVKWGCSGKPEMLLTNGPPLSYRSLPTESFPDGVPFVTVMDDPEGVDITPAKKSNQRIEELEMRMEQMAAELALARKPEPHDPANDGRMATTERAVTPEFSPADVPNLPPPPPAPAPKVFDQEASD